MLLLVTYSCFLVTLHLFHCSSSSLILSPPSTIFHPLDCWRQTFPPFLLFSKSSLTISLFFFFRLWFLELNGVISRLLLFTFSFWILQQLHTEHNVICFTTWWFSGKVSNMFPTRTWLSLWSIRLQSMCRVFSVCFFDRERHIDLLFSFRRCHFSAALGQRKCRLMNGQCGPNRNGRWFCKKCRMDRCIQLGMTTTSESLVEN